MATFYNAQIDCKSGKYRIQFETTNHDYFKAVEKACQKAIDKKDKAVHGVCLGENKELAEVKHAFRTLNVGHRSFCSNCEGLAVCEKYCSLCGAKMDGGKKE